MNSTRTCGRCGAVVPAHAPENLCLRCLFDTAVDLDEADAPGARVAIPGDATRAPIEQNTPPPVFGDYELLAELGRGGQGVVYRARHRGLGRLVALKTIPPAHLAGAHARERFRLEASTASRLDHPNIVPIYEVGERDGFCFYSMKLVEGGNLAQRIAGEKMGKGERERDRDASCSGRGETSTPTKAVVALPLPGGEGRGEGERSSDCPFAPRTSALLLLKVAHAVHHAHQRGVLHRDLKPSNILLDHDGEPHVSDFGLARQTDEDSSLTVSHALIGTPAYLSPEVALGGARQATVVSDIYGLGAILYQLLTGQSPFVRATMAETLRAVQEEEPARPGKLNPAVPGDLETVCLKCLEKNPTKRYGTALELADDLARFLRDEPILARPITRAERAWRWCRRKPALAGFVAATALLLLAILIGSPLAAYRINQALKAEQVQLKRAEGESLKARQFAYASDMNLAHQAVQEDDFYRALQLLDRHRPKEVESRSELRVERGAKADDAGTSSPTLNSQLKPLSTDLRGWEWRYLWRQCQGEERFILGEHANGATAVGLLADGKTVFSAGRDKFVRLWDLESRRQKGLLPHSEEVIGAAASPNGRWLAVATAKEGEARPVLLWDFATQKIATNLNTITSDFTNFWLRPGSITFSPDSKWLAFATMWGGVRLWDVDARREVTNLPANNKLNFLLGLAFSPDSRTLAYNENDYGAIVLWDIASRSVSRLAGHQSAVTALAFSPDGQTLASGSQDRTARLWNLAELREKYGFTNPSGGITSLAFSPDGRTLALGGTGSAGQVIRLVDVENGRHKADLRGHLEDVSSLAFTPDGQSLLSASEDGTLRVWDVVLRAKAKPVHEFAQNSISTEWSSYGPALCLSPDGRHLLTVYTNETFSLWDTLRLAEGERHPLPFTNATIAAVAPGGRQAAFASRSGEVMLWDVEMGQARFFARPVTNKIHRLVFSLDGRSLSVADDTKTLSQMFGSNDDPRRTIRVWDVGARRETRVFSSDGEFPVSLTFSADAKSLLVGCWRGPVKLWPLDGPGAGATFLGHSAGVRGLALLPDGQTLISAAQEIRFWDVRTRHETDKLNPRAGRFFAVALSADGRRLATGASDGLITIWDVASRQEVATLEGHKESVMQLAFTPDGDHLVSVSKDQLRVWRAASQSEAEAGFQKLNPH